MEPKSNWFSTPQVIAQATETGRSNSMLMSDIAYFCQSGR